MCEDPNRAFVGLGPPDPNTCNFANIPYPACDYQSDSAIFMNSRVECNFRDYWFFSAKFSVLLLWVNQIKGVLSEIQGFS
jgi:hypothetical protein